MKTIISTVLLIMLTSISYSQKTWELVPKEKTNVVLFTPSENDTTDVKILLKDELVEAKKVSKVIMRVSGNYNGELYYKVLHYIVDGKIVKTEDVLFEREVIFNTNSIQLWNGSLTPNVIYDDNIIELNTN